MAFQLMKDEVLKEMEAVKCFIDLAIKAQKSGYTTAAQYFLAQAQEDCKHAFLYARELDKHDEIPGNMTITEIVKKFQDLEAGAIKRVTAIQQEAIKENIHSILPFIIHILEDHSEEAYVAKKLLQKVSILDEQQALNDIEELFQRLLDSEEK